LPLVSVVIATYNQARYVAAAIESALSQTLRDFEIVVVDDGSTDNTWAVLDRYGVAIRVVREPNAGQAVARNRGVAESRGEFIAFLDGDDIWLPEKLDRQVNAIRQQPGAGFCACGYYIADEELRSLGSKWPAPAGNQLQSDLLLGNRIGPPTTVIVKRDQFELVSGFDPALSYCCDWDLWIRLAQVTGFCAVNEILAAWRQHGGNLSRDIRSLEHDSVRLLKKALSDPRTPTDARSGARQVHGHNWSVLAGSYWKARRFCDSFRCLGNALIAAPVKTMSTFAHRYCVDCVME